MTGHRVGRGAGYASRLRSVWLLAIKRKQQAEVEPSAIKQDDMWRRGLLCYQ